MRTRPSLTLLLACAACAPPAREDPPAHPGPPPAPMAYALFDVSSDVVGAVRLGEPVVFETTVHARAPVDRAVLTLAMPEVAAARVSGWGSGYRPYGVGVRPPAIDSVVARIAPGSALQRRTAVRFEAPGYYQVIAAARADDEERYEENGVPLVDPQHHSYYVWIDDEAGYATRDFDPTRLPLASDGSHGPLRMTRGAGLALLLDSARAAPRTHAVVYGAVRDVNGVPVAGARVQARAYMEGCPGRGAAEEVTRTDPSGNYRLLLRGWPRSEFDACVALHVDLDGRHGTARTAVGMRQATAAPDSVRVELRLADPPGS